MRFSQPHDQNAGPVQGPQARARPAPDLPPQRRAHPRHITLCSCPGASRGRRDHHRRHLATAPPRAGAHASGRVRRPRRRITQRTETTPRQRELRALEIKNRSWRSTCRPSGRAADGASVRVGTTRHPAWSHQACSQASSADPFTNNCRTRSNICAACVAGYHHPNDDGLVLSPRRGVERCQCECRTR